jgi:ubiquinone biosynthesis protein COQ9
MNEEAKSLRVEDLRDRIVLATLPHVAFEGWSDRAVRNGLADIRLTPEQRLLTFAGGPVEMIEHWMRYADHRMLERMQGLELAAMRVRERIAAAVRFRIEVNLAYREAVRRTISFLALPSNAIVAARSMYATIDAIWYACGDASTDLSFYTKRATLAAVYGTTVLYWLDDSSDQFLDTWAFLDRRIDDVMQIPKLRARIEQAWSGMARPPIRSFSGGAQLSRHCR